MKNIKAVVGVLLIFILGVTCGTLVTHMIYKARIETIISGGPEMREEHLVKRLSRKLGLDSQQREQIKAILDETQSEMRLVRKQLQPQIEDILEKGQVKIRQILRPEQQEKYEKIITERKERRKK